MLQVAQPVFVDAGSWGIDHPAFLSTAPDLSCRQNADKEIVQILVFVPSDSAAITFGTLAYFGDQVWYRAESSFQINLPGQVALTRKQGVISLEVRH